jgi:hypothetical protein
VVELSYQLLDGGEHARRATGKSTPTGDVQGYLNIESPACTIAAQSDEKQEGACCVTGLEPNPPALPGHSFYAEHARAGRVRAALIGANGSRDLGVQNLCAHSGILLSW